VSIEIEPKIMKKRAEIDHYYMLECVCNFSIAACVGNRTATSFHSLGR